MGEFDCVWKICPKCSCKVFDSVAHEGMCTELQKDKKINELEAELTITKENAKRLEDPTSCKGCKDDAEMAMKCYDCSRHHEDHYQKENE